MVQDGLALGLIPGVGWRAAEIRRVASEAEEAGFAAVFAAEVNNDVLATVQLMGEAIVANKIHGVRASVCNDQYTAEMARRHNDANVLCLSADLLGDRLVTRMVELWLKTEFEGGRHARRVDKISQFESGRATP